MGTDEKYEVLVRLERATEKGQLTWEGLDEFRFRTYAGNSAFLISSRDQDDMDPYELHVWNGDTELGSIETEPHSGAKQRHINTLLRALYRVAKRQALSLDVAVSSVLEDLRKADPEELPPEPPLPPPDPDNVPF